MAPTKKRSSIRAKAAARSSTSTKPTTSFADLGAAFSEDSGPTDPGITTQLTKREKRSVKSINFLTKVASTGLTNSAGIKKKSRRNRGQEAKARGKLVTSLTSLADALPGFDDDDDDMEGDGVEAANKMIGIPGVSDANITFAKTRAGNLVMPGGMSAPKKMKSLGTKRGMGKRKEKLEQVERQKFQNNVAVLMGDERFGFGSTAQLPESGDKGEEQAAPKGAIAGLQALRAVISKNIAIQKSL